MSQGPHAELSLRGHQTASGRAMAVMRHSFSKPRVGRVMRCRTEGHAIQPEIKNAVYAWRRRYRSRRVRVSGSVHDIRSCSYATRHHPPRRCWLPHHAGALHVRNVHHAGATRSRPPRPPTSQALTRLLRNPRLHPLHSHAPDLTDRSSNDRPPDRTHWPMAITSRERPSTWASAS